MSYIVIVIDRRSTGQRDYGETIPGFAAYKDALEVAERINANAPPYRYAAVRRDTCKLRGA